MSSPSQPPRAAVGALARAEAWFVRVNQWIVIALMAVMALLVFTNVISRYLFNYSIIWVEELTQYQMIWIAYLGAGLALREGRHVAVEVGQDLLPPALRLWMRRLIGFAIGAMLVALVVLGYQIAAFTWDQETPVMNISTGIPYLAVPIGAAAFLLHLILFWREFVERRFIHPEEHHEEAI